MDHVFERTIARDGACELEIRKSRFICSLFRVSGEVEARAAIDGIRKEHRDANHHCTAWRIGAQGRLQRSSDGGEPAGTAGVPMLEVLIQRGLTDIVAIVTRYFGGTKLGAGGLIRACGTAVSAAIDRVGIVERRPMRIVEVVVSHSDAGRAEHALRSSSYRLADVAYNAAEVTLVAHLDPVHGGAFTSLVADVTAGRASFRDAGVVFVEVPVQPDDVLVPVCPMD